MKRNLIIALTASFIIVLSFTNKLQACTGGSNSGTLTPTSAYQTQAVSSGQYYVVNVSCGSTYNFTFLSNGGSAGWDTQLTVNQTDNTTQLAYNDDFGGFLQSEVSWTATFNGTVHILVSEYSCVNDGAQSGTLAYNVSPTTISYTASCASATASINGATGGTFTFNPVPGDGATINSTSGAISNATMSASYTVDYTYCGGTASVNVTMGSEPCYTLNGNASYITVGGEDCIQLTPESNDQTGCAWNETIIDFNSDFSLSLNYYFGNNVNGADGTTFTFQPNPGACGTNGGQLGAGGIASSLIVEFDTYDNDNPTHAVDIAADHIAIEVDGNLQNSTHLAGPISALSSGASIDDGVTRNVEIVWNAATQTLEVYFAGALRLSSTYDFVTNVFGGDNTVYWGATAATGGMNNQQYFCPSTVLLPVELYSLESKCDEGKEILIWQTASESRTDYFQVEYTYDGNIFYPIGIVDAAGNSQDLLTYSLDISHQDSRQRYYRLKMVDIDGEFKLTDIISSKNCNSEIPLISNVKMETSKFMLLTSEDAEVSVVDQLGQLIYAGEQNNGVERNYNVSLSSGIYFIQVKGLHSGKKELRKILIG